MIQGEVIGICAGIAMGVQIIGFLICFFILKSKGDQFYDFFGCIGFLSQLFFLLFYYYPDLDVKQYICFGIVTVWCLRLGIFLFIRAKLFKGDSRFDEIKKNAVSFFVAFILQAVWNYITILPAIFLLSTSYDEINSTFNYLNYIGLSLYAIGLYIESVADGQKLRFKLDQNNKGKYISSGLWKYSRHPNYLGEFIIQTGIFVFCCSEFQGAEFTLVLCPIFIICLISFISGIPKLEQSAEKRWGLDQDYIQYKQKSGVICFGFL